MSRHHPLDDAFRGKLQGLSTETPMHLWAHIDQKRTWRHRFLNKVRQYRPFAAVLASALAAGGGMLLWNSQQPVLTGFPVKETTYQSPIASRSGSAQLKKEAAELQINAGSVMPVSSGFSEALNKKPVSVSQNTERFTAWAEKKQIASLLQPMASAALTTAGKDARKLLLSPTSARGYTAVSPRPATEAKLPALAAVYEKEASHPLPALFNPEPKCAQFGNGRWSVYIDLMASPDLAFSDLRARSPNFEDYAASRRETESFVFAFSGGFRLSLEAENGLALRTGINYSQVNEKFTYFNGTERREITEPVRDNQGNIIGYDTIVTIGERYKISRNTYRMLDIPFILGYEMQAGKLGLAVNGGAYLNLLFRQSGDFLSPETLTPVPLNPEDPNSANVFKRQAGVGYYGSVSLTYATKSGLELLLEPYFKMFPNSVTRDQFAVQQRHMNAGVFLGARLYL